MNRLVLLAAAGALILTSAAGCNNQEDKEAASQTAVRYWNNLFSGNTRSAYQMLDKKSQGFLPYPDYSRKVGVGPVTAPEIEAYWDAYFPNTQIEAREVYLKGKQAGVTLDMTIPDPTWFPDKARLEAESKGLEGEEYATYILQAQTRALEEGRVPLVRIEETTRLVKEGQTWKVVFTEEG